MEVRALLVWMNVEAVGILIVVKVAMFQVLF
jgi:hypothetical protein